MGAIAPPSPCSRIPRAWRVLLLMQCFLIAVISFSFADSQYTTTDAGPTTTPEPPLTWFECPDQYSYHAHPANCTQYIICVFGKAYLRACEGGLHWNDQLRLCDWPNSKTTCQQVDDNTAYRPFLSPVITPPPQTDEENSQSQRDEYQTETQGRFRGSQGFSRFKPDEDAAKDQLTSFAGKKVVYYDAPKDANVGDTAPSVDNAIGPMRPDSDDRGQPGTNQDSYSGQRDVPPKKKSTGPQMMPIGQINRNSNRGAPQRMSSWDTGNDDFPQADAPDIQVSVSRPQFKQGPPKSRSAKPPMNDNAAAQPVGNPPPWAQMALQRKRGDIPPTSYSDDSNQPSVKQQPTKASGLNPPPWLKQKPQTGRNTPSQPRGNPIRSRVPENMPNDDESMPSQNRPQGNFSPRKVPTGQQDYQPPPRRINQGEQANRNRPSDDGPPVKPQTYQPGPDRQNDEMPPPRSPQKMSQGFIPSATRPQQQNQNNPQRQPMNQRPPNSQGNRAEKSNQRSPTSQQKPSNRRGPTDFSISEADSSSFSRTSGAQQQQQPQQQQQRQQRPVFDDDRSHQDASSFGQSERPRFPNPASTNTASESESQFGAPQRMDSRPPSKPSRAPPPPSRQTSNDREDESMNVPTRFGSQSDGQSTPVRSFDQQRAAQSNQNPSRNDQRPPPPSRPAQSHSRESGSSSRDPQQWSGGFSRNSQTPAQSAGSYSEKGNAASVLDELNDGPSKVGAHRDEDEGRDGPNSFDTPNRIWNFGNGGRGMPDMMGPPPGYGIFAGDSGDDLDQPASSNFNFQRFRDFYGGV